MRYKHPIFLFLICVIFPFISLAQKNDSIKTLSAISISYDHQFPFADLGELFLAFSLPSLSYDLHHRSGFVFSINGGYMFKDTIKQTGVLNDIEKDGFLIDGEGQIVNVFLFQRGFTISGKVSKKIAIGSAKNYLQASFGGGFMQHKILLYSEEFALPQVQGEYEKGYDQLSNGFMLEESLLFMHQPTRKSYILFAGLRALQGFTQNRRSYNFDIMGPNTTKRQDFSIGFQFGISILFNRKVPQDFYFY